MRRPRAPGYLVVVALLVLFLMTVMSLALIYVGQQGDLVYRQERTHNLQEALFDDTVDRLGSLLSGVSTPGQGLSLDGDVHVTGPDGSWLRARWGGGDDSLRRESPAGYNTWDNLFDDGKDVDAGDDPSPSMNDFPDVGYADAATKTALGSVQVPPSQTVVEWKGPLLNYRAAYSASFPYGVYAPTGSVTASSVQAWTNPLLSEVKKPSNSAVPVLVRAQDSVKVSGAWPVGFAYSDHGPIDVSGGAVGFTRKQPADRFAAPFRDAVGNAFDVLSDGQVDKTNFLYGHDLDLTGLINAGKGEANLLGILSVQQAMMMPFMPVVSTVNNPPFMSGLVIYHPYPPDTSTSSVSKDFSQQASDLSQQIDKLNKEIAQYADSRNPDDQANVAQWRSELQGLQGQQDALGQQAQQLRDQFGSRIMTNVPLNADQEGSFVTYGWSYAWIIEYLGTMVKDLFTGQFEEMYETLYRPTRLVHLANTIPNWYFPDGLPKMVDGYPRVPPASVRSGYLSMEAVWTVPPGRTCKIVADTQIRGALWIQRGASMYIAGSLVVSPADDWFLSDPGVTVDREDPLYPDGRIYLEEGATLLVDGDLTVEGGSTTGGSILVACPLGSVQPINSAILCKGNVSITHGIQPGMTLEELFLSFSSQSEGAASMFRFLRVFLPDIAPNVAKYLGPFEERTCWFADYATTIESFPLLPIVGDLPLPIPLPYPNCLREKFESVAWYSTVNLNMWLGENLYPMALWWPFDNGGVPMFAKVDPALLSQGLADIPVRKDLGSWDNLKTDILGYLGDVWTFSKRYLITWAAQYVESLVVQKLIPFDIPTECPSGEEGEDGGGESASGGGDDGGGSAAGENPVEGGGDDPPADNPADDGDGDGKDPAESKGIWDKDSPVRGAVTDWLREALDWGVWDFKYYFGQLLAQVDSEIRSASEEGWKDPLYAEAPGLLVYAGGALTIGGDVGSQQAQLASGFFVAEGDIRIGANWTVGSVVSLTGDVEVGDLYYYPWFTRASLYVPKKPKDFDFNSPVTSLDEVLQFTVPQSESPALDLGSDWYRATAQGGSR